MLFCAPWMLKKNQLFWGVMKTMACRDSREIFSEMFLISPGMYWDVPEGLRQTTKGSLQILILLRLNTEIRTAVKYSNEINHLLSINYQEHAESFGTLNVEKKAEL